MVRSLLLYYHVPAAIPSPITVTFSTPTPVNDSYRLIARHARGLAEMVSLMLPRSAL
jgi:hypothetical protein